MVAVRMDYFWHSQHAIFNLSSLQIFFMHLITGQSVNITLFEAVVDSRSTLGVVPEYTFVDIKGGLSTGLTGDASTGLNTVKVLLGDGASWELV